MYAIIDLNGKQYEVEEGRYVVVDRLAHEPDATLEIGNVLMVVDGENSLVGAPFVDGASIQARVLNHFRGPKKIIYKMRCKKGYRRKNGYRDDLTRLQIEVLEFPGKKATAAPKKAEKPAQEEQAPVEEKPKAKKSAPKAPKAETAEKAEKKPAAKKAKKQEEATESKED